MGSIRHVYPGGNTCYGFYSYYTYMVGPDVEHKIVLKGGPGVGKSTFMSKVGADLAGSGHDVEYHWCSSDNDSLDGVVIGAQRLCLVDGTSPHIVDPAYPGAVDEILNLGEYWNAGMIKAHRYEIENLSREISQCFARAYGRLHESQLALNELKSHCEECRDPKTTLRNVQALTADFLPGALASYRKPRHLFAGAITPGGLVTKMDTLINHKTAIFAVKGSPGSGTQDLFRHTLHSIEIGGIYAEVFHNPLDPNDIDYILIPSNNALLIDMGAGLLPYKELLKGLKLKRQLDFDQLLNSELLAARAKLIFSASHRYTQGITEAVQLIQTAKKWHDELETYYIPAMNFEAIENRRLALVDEWRQRLDV